RTDQGFLGDTAEFWIDGHALDHDRLRVLLLRQSHDVLLFPQVRGRRRRTLEDDLPARGVDEFRHLPGRLHDDTESVRSERRPDETTRAGLPAASVDMNPDRDRLEAIGVAPPFPNAEKTDGGPDGRETDDQRSPTPERDQAGP